MYDYSRFVGLGFALLVVGLYLLLAALSAVVGRFVWFGIADGWSLALLGSLSMLLGVAFIKLQNKIMPEEGEADGMGKAGA